MFLRETLYQSIIRSVLEYAAPVMFPMMTGEMIYEIERVQKICLRIIYGFDKTYEWLKNESGLNSIEMRMRQATRKFAESLPGSQLNNWFPRVQGRPYDFRNPPQFLEELAITERLHHSPIFTYRRILNNHE